MRSEGEVRSEKSIQNKIRNIPKGVWGNFPGSSVDVDLKYLWIRHNTRVTPFIILAAGHRGDLASQNNTPTLLPDNDIVLS